MRRSKRLRCSHFLPCDGDDAPAVGEDTQQFLFASIIIFHIRGLRDPQIEAGNFSSLRCALLLEEKEEEGVESASNYPFHLFLLPSQRSSHRVRELGPN